MDYIIPELRQHAVELDKLKLDPANANTHPEKNLRAIMDSLSAFGQRQVVLARKGTGVVIAGNGRLMAARALGWTHIACAFVDDDDITAVRYAIADNRTSELSEWDNDVLSMLLGTIKESFGSLDGTGFDDGDVDALLAEVGGGKTEGLTDPDEVPEAPEKPVTIDGDVWLLGQHRLMCGDSTSIEAVERLMAGAKAEILHADPPYGMGKESEGIVNDNLYRDKLDAFQMAWWRAFRPFLADNASAYIWGNAPELWRLWYVGGLSDSERFTFRNEIVWSKGDAGAGGISHQGSEGLRLYPQSTERCLFFVLGEQGFNNNADNYWEGWEPIRSYLESEMKRAGWTTKDLNEITGTRMGGHWVTKSQWSLITAEHYAKIQAACAGDAFKREHDALKREHDALKRDFYATRAYFDNAHDNMTDVWEFPRVKGEERHGHATPKPVSMMARAIKSSTPEGGLVVEPFLGSGSTLIAAEQLGRKCYGMEISSQYCDVIINRWQDFAGKTATLESTGQTFDEVRAERHG